jgi:hypothetical protein
MDILERVARLEKEVELLKASQKEHNFHVVLNSMSVTEDDLQQVYHSAMFPHVVRIILETNQKTPFLKVKRKLCRFENEWIAMTDYDIEILVKHVESLFIQLHSKNAAKYSPDDFFQKVKVIYGLTVNVRKFKTELMNSL